MVKPITPDNVVELKKTVFPDQVFEAFNEMIARNYLDGKATVKQDDVVDLICEKMNVTSNRIFDNNWLDVEDIYRTAGWKVNYDKPAYCESYPAYFEFTKKPK